MTIQTAHSVNPEPGAAARELVVQLGTIDPTVVVFFASSAYDPAEVSRAVQDAFPGARTLGCTTAGEIVTGQMLKGSLVAMALDADTMPEVHVEVIHDLTNPDGIARALAAFEDHAGRPMRELDVSCHVGLVLVDGLSGAEERLMDRIGALTDIAFVGGSAGDDLKFKATHVFANGSAYTGAAVLALLRPARGFDILKTQSFGVLPRTLVVTRADEHAREVLEFDGKPARVAYAEAVGKSVEEAAHAFMHNPVGVMVGDEPYVRSPQRFAGDHIVFFCNIQEGMEVSLLESRDIVEDTRAALAGKVRETGPLAGIVNFHCILRTLELEQKGQTGAYGRLFAAVPTVGFSTYGEEYLGHINQTSTMLLLR
jgi:hypothetical protein